MKNKKSLHRILCDRSSSNYHANHVVYSNIYRNIYAYLRSQTCNKSSGD